MINVGISTHAKERIKERAGKLYTESEMQSIVNRAYENRFSAKNTPSERTKKKIWKHLRRGDCYVGQANGFIFIFSKNTVQPLLLTMFPIVN